MEITKKDVREFCSKLWKKVYQIEHNYDESVFRVMADMRASMSEKEKMISKKIARSGVYNVRVLILLASDMPSEEKILSSLDHANMEEYCSYDLRDGAFKEIFGV
jgi:hypothetical protein